MVIIETWRGRNERLSVFPSVSGRFDWVFTLIGCADVVMVFTQALCREGFMSLGI
jgi:hypothetical protein